MSSLSDIKQTVITFAQQVESQLWSMETYTELFVVGLIYLLAYLFSKKIGSLVEKALSYRKKSRALIFEASLNKLSKIALPISALILLNLASEFLPKLLGHGVVLDGATIIASILFFLSLCNVFIVNPLVQSISKWIGLPILILHLVGLLDEIIAALDSMNINIGNIDVSIYDVLRVLIFGTVLFWMGRVSNNTGKKIIRNQESLDIRTREVFSKLFEVSIFFTVFLLLLQVMGINLTTLAVFGGALGVGLGFGLQSIASNFISGLIILLDRSITLGDYIQLEDGRTGVVTDMDLRSTTLETYDGKDIVVPNEKFISSSFTNWTHKNKKQRYRVDFSVAYETNIRELVEIIKTAVATHPQVISGEDIPFEERPDCEIDSFGDSGINMFVEFWMEGIDDGKNRVGGDLLLLILETLRENDIEIPFPQREVKVLNRANI